MAPEENDWTSRLDKLWSGSVAGQLTMLTEMMQTLLQRPAPSADGSEGTAPALQERLDGLSAALDSVRSVREDTLALASMVEDRVREDGQAVRDALAEARHALSTRIDLLGERVDALAASLADMIEQVRVRIGDPPSAAPHEAPNGSTPAASYDWPLRDVVDLAPF